MPRWALVDPDPGRDYWHGTDAVLAEGQVLTPAGANAYGRKHPESDPRYLYLAATRADAGHGPHIYRVWPLGGLEVDAGPMAEGYRTVNGVLVLGEV